MPSPEELGIARPPTPQTSGDGQWEAAHRRLRQLGAICYRLDRLPQGYRFTCLLPTASETRSHRVEAQAATEAEAVLLVLDQAEQWTRTR